MSTAVMSLAAEALGGRQNPEAARQKRAARKRPTCDGNLAASGLAELNTTERPNHEEDDQHEDQPPH
jgi:hypothetical protein